MSLLVSLLVSLMLSLSVSLMLSLLVSLLASLLLSLLLSLLFPARPPAMVLRGRRQQTLSGGGDGASYAVGGRVGEGDDGVDGFIVPIRSAEAIAEKLELLRRDPARLAAMKDAALSKARSLTWESYRRGIVEAVSQTLGPAPL